MNSRWITTACRNSLTGFLGFVALAASADPIAPAPPQSISIRVTGATIHTVSADVIENAQMLFDAGRIVAIGSAGTPSPEAGQTIDLTGLHIYPGMISANTTLGLVEIEGVRATLDVAEPGSINPNVRAERAVNPDSALFPVTRANGVLAALTVPQTSANGLIAGQSAVIELDGWTWEDMTLRARVGMHIDWPTLVFPAELPDVRRAELEKARDEQRELLRKSFEDALAYGRAREAGEDQPIDLRWEAMLPVLDGTQPVFVHADRLVEIRDALAFAEEYGLALVLVGGADAWRIADTLAQRDIAVIVSNVHRLPLRRWEGYSTPSENAVRLAEAGVRFAIAGDGTPFEAAHERNLPYEAADAVAHGLPEIEGLRAVTLYPAQILGIDDRLGSLDVGKDATFIVTDGNPLDIRTHVLAAWIRGRPVDLTSRHTQLYEKYQERQRQLTDQGAQSRH
jgi:imidazolonepropionase-like amidohydrolase